MDVHSANEPMPTKKECLLKFKYKIFLLKPDFLPQKLHPTKKHVHEINSICTRYLVGAPFAWNTASLWWQKGYNSEALLRH